jgi:hypothetical protein
MILGRRSGKTRAAAVLAVYLGILCDFSDRLVIGERGLVAKNAAIAFSVFSRSAARSAATHKRRALEPFAF